MQVSLMHGGKAYGKVVTPRIREYDPGDTAHFIITERWVDEQGVQAEERLDRQVTVGFADLDDQIEFAKQLAETAKELLKTAREAQAYHAD